MNPHRRHPFIRVATFLVYGFLYAPILVLVLFAFNASRVNVLFEGFIPAFGSLQMDGSLVTQSPCGPFHWFCELAENREVGQAARNTLCSRYQPVSWPFAAVSSSRGVAGTRSSSPMSGPMRSAFSTQTATARYPPRPATESATVPTRWPPETSTATA